MQASDKKIEDSVFAGRPVHFRFYSLLPESEKTLHFVISSILQCYEKYELLTPVYTAVKELALNAVKANVTKLLVAREKLNSDSESDRQKASALLKQSLSEGNMASLGIQARELNLFVEVQFLHNARGLEIKVINNSRLTKQEEANIKEKLRQGLMYEDMARYYLENPQSDPSGAGIILIQILLRSEGIDPAGFSVRSDPRLGTVARVLFPFYRER